MKKIILLIFVMGFIVSACKTVTTNCDMLYDEEDIPIIEAVVFNDSSEKNIIVDDIIVNNSDVFVDVKNFKIKEAIMFEYDSSEIKDDQISIIKKVSDLMKKYTAVTLFLDGYASKEGKKLYNIILSEKRANSVKKILVENGVEDDRIMISEHGATDLFGDVLSENRRVLILSLSNFTELH